MGWHGQAREVKRVKIIERTDILMRSDLSEAVLRAIEVAQQRATEDSLSALDILAGLLAEEEGRAWMVLADAGLDVLAFRTSLPHLTQLVPPGRTLREYLEDASFLARSLSSERTVSSEIMLLSLLQEESELLREMCQRGLRFQELESRLTAGAGPPLELEQPLALPEMTERIDTARVLDACANRAREALRVLEDYTRFCLDDAFLSRELKELRHQLREAMELVPDTMLLQSRETLRDVGVSISTESERSRVNLREIVQANCKRLTEALRSLEEFGKLIHADLGSRLEQVRYRAYTIERSLLMGASSRDRLRDGRIQVLLTGSQCLAALDWTIAEAAAGGADIIQLREKSLNDRDFLERARNVRRWTHQAGVLFIVNDRPDIARLVEADGVHLGQDDMPVKEARRIVGPELLIGVSTHNLDQVRQAVLDGASYLGVGPTFPSKTKSFDDFPGLDFVRAASKETSLPQFVIGGVNTTTLSSAVDAGARRIAVSAAVSQHEDPQRVVAMMRAML